MASKTFRNASARVVFLHIPLDGGTWHGSNHLRNLFLPILNEAGINIMFSGHTHRYGFHPANDEGSRSWSTAIKATYGAT